MSVVIGSRSSETGSHDSRFKQRATWSHPEIFQRLEQSELRRHRRQRVAVQQQELHLAQAAHLPRQLGEKVARELRDKNRSGRQSDSDVALTLSVFSLHNRLIAGGTAVIRLALRSKNVNCVMPNTPAGNSANTLLLS